ncbi:tryptophan synthase subunit beta [Oenococcus kitaharae]|uniref:Tryptophan synthase beta chain n=1 Tax=Oenococcus kitaharae DSM 17330 TaxID=1045004 RepID=G9WHY5_9LACO|nr:tryptophan synthase subunit beta [Oenococcus kitaharae]EHN58870.1 Tryptophan synthase beta chain [Oenococcus kitaharae DSM 17330]OEY81802.1 tryptophan synthase subunit beta [Oenococcus kitaharae]OEY84033.1 tryptophan synthase subunit beta [Oenococcus kitaharae]OEY85609.1 tryptophan synthase subunit beta [Oenococcus kitaharae]
MTEENTAAQVKRTGYFGDYGGQYVPEAVKTALNKLEKVYLQYKDDSEFRTELAGYLKDYSGRETSLYYAESLTKYLGGAKVYLKREDLNHLGAHKLNNVLGQILLARRMGKKRVVAETGAGQHGVATAAAAAKFGMSCDIFMGAMDMQRQKLNVFRMEMMGATVHSVSAGTATLKNAVDAALGYYAQHLDDTFYVLGSAVGPHPYPTIVKDFQSVISKEARRQILEKEGRLPDAIIACIGGGSNAIGAFAEFIPDKNVRLIGAEAAGKGVDTPENAATMTNGRPGIADGMFSYLLQDAQGGVLPAYSISAGLDYPGVGPEHSFLKDTHRAEYYAITDKEAVDAFLLLSKLEGIIPALESSHAVAQAVKMVPKMSKDQIVIINLSGRGDKDVEQVAHYIGRDL